MRLTKFFLILFALALVISFISCAKMTVPEKDVIIKITARRIAHQGLKIQPDVFRSLAIIARESCQHLTVRSQPSDVSFRIIFKTIATKTQDPLLARDIQDVIELIGIKFDPSFQLVGITPERLKLITLFVCSFSEGSELFLKRH